MQVILAEIAYDESSLYAKQQLKFGKLDFHNGSS